VTDRPPKSRDASKPFSWDDLTEDENIAAHNFWLNMEYVEEVKAAITSSDIAVTLLSDAAGYLERREQMPFHLADHIAKAFRATVKAKATDALSKTEAKRNTLAAMLNITAPGKRPKVTDEEVGLSIFRLLLERAQSKRPLSETAATKEVAGMLGKKHRTIKDHWKNWKDSNSEEYKLMNKFLKGYKKLGG